MMEIITQIVINLTRLLVAGCLAYICKSVIPAVTPWLKQVGLYRIVSFFVNAAEKMADTKKIPKETKKQFVKKILAKIGIEDNEIIDAMIEGAVEELDNQKGKIKDAFDK